MTQSPGSTQVASRAPTTGQWLTSIRLMLRGMWWRRGLIAALFGIAVVTTTGAALGPVYARASAESILQDHLIQATWRAGISLHHTLDIGAPTEYQRLLDRSLRPGEIRGYNTRRAGFYTPNGVGAAPSKHSGSLATHLAWIDGQCRQLVIVRGHCPTSSNEVMLSQRTVATGIYPRKLGSRIYVGTLANPNDPNYYTAPHPVPPPMRMVGVYRPRNAADPFWFGRDYFDAHPGGFRELDTIDSLFVAKSEFTTRPPNTYVEADLNYPLTPAQVRLSDVATERAAVEHAVARYNHRGVISADSGLAGVFDAAATEKHIVDVATLLVTLQLTLLAWLVLFQVAADAIAARADEVAMAKLRGHSFGTVVRFGLGEPILVLAAAVPVGIAMAILITNAFAASTFVPGVPVTLTWAPIGAGLLAFAGGLAAAAAGGLRTLRRSVLDQWRGTTRRPGRGWPLIAADVLLATGALVALIVLLSDPQAGRANDSAALLSPGLLVFAVALVGVRLLPLGCRWLAHRTRASGRVGTFLASRQVARRPAGLRLAALLAVAVGLATFAVAGESVAASNRERRAQAELGAPRVVAVQFGPAVDPVAATHRADPDGHWAMTTATWLPDGGNSVLGTVLGIDAPRLNAVAYPQTSPTSSSALAAALAPPVAAIEISSHEIRVHLTTTGLTGSAAPDVQLNFRTSSQPNLNAEGAPIQAGSHTYRVPVNCAPGCQLRGVTWDRPISASGRVAGIITLTGLDERRGDAWHPLDIGLGVTQSWHAATPQGQASDHVTVSRDGVRDQFQNLNGGYGGIAYSSDPSPMPAIVTPNAVSDSTRTTQHGSMIDASNTTAKFAIAQTTAVLPAVLDRGLIMNLNSLQNELPAFGAEATWRIWLGSDAPPDAVKRLSEAGLQVSATSSATRRDNELAREAPALALLLLLVCAVAGAVLAAGGTAISITASGRRRTYELAALRAVGVSRRSLLRASVTEQLLLLGTAVLLGVPTGLLAAHVAMPAIPEFATPTPITLHYSPGLIPTTLFVCAFIILLIITAYTAGHALIRAAVPSRLRTAE